MDEDNIIKLTEPEIETAMLEGPPLRELCKVLCSKELVDAVGDEFLEGAIHGFIEGVRGEFLRNSLKPLPNE